MPKRPDPMPDPPGVIALGDQRIAEARQSAQVVATYFNTLIAEGVDEDAAAMLTESYQDMVCGWQPHWPGAGEPG